ncbi:hypothetical protein M514_25668 [Trichuris suis]|uniref:Uncharacterized protein n=1 Tax=Trichuris suis TaxID=68888 RepID=A0A085MY87_9BILA|nr:hypothetical protein M514_25668 [Trichuris suis]
MLSYNSNKTSAYLNRYISRDPSFIREVASKAYPMECICCAAAFPEPILVVRDVYDVSQSGVYDSFQNLQVRSFRVKSRPVISAMCVARLVGLHGCKPLHPTNFDRDLSCQLYLEPSSLGPT